MINLISALKGRSTEASATPPWGDSFERLQRRLAVLNGASTDFLENCEFLKLPASRKFNVDFSNETGQQALDGRAITIACVYKKKHILGAISVVVDSGTSLPLEQSHKNNINLFRSMGRQMAEITALVLNNRILGNTDLRYSKSGRLVVVLSLLKTAIGYLQTSTGVDTIVTRLNRRHDSIYKALLFRPLNTIEYYTKASTQKYPAFFLDLSFLTRNPERPVSRLLNDGQAPINLEAAA